MGHKNHNRQTQNPRNGELTIQAVSRSFSGLLPPPEALERYNQVLPGAAERILAMAESQQVHRQGLERTVVASNTRAQNRGPWLGFIVAMTAVLGGIFLIYSGREATGLTSIISALAALIGVFVYGKREQQKDLTKKSTALTTTADR